MCFSPTVSFTASAALAVIGVVTIRSTKNKKELLLASVALLFAVQQFTEGLLWLILLNGGSGDEQYWVTQAYSVFVGMVWPVFIPLSVYRIERRKNRRRLMLGVIGVGVVVALYTLYIILTFGVKSDIENRCILYEAPHTHGIAVTITYVIATCLAFFFSSARGIVKLGMIYMATFFIAYYFYRMNYVSVWCFFSAVVSGFIYLYFNRRVIEDKVGEALG